MRHCVCNKFTDINLKFLLKYKPCLNQEICTDQAAFTSENSFNQICQWILMWVQQGMDFSTGGKVIDWLLLARSNALKLKCLGDVVSYKHTALHFTRCLLMDWSHAFISCFNSHSESTHSLQGIHWWTIHWRGVYFNFRVNYSFNQTYSEPDGLASPDGTQISNQATSKMPF